MASTYPARPTNELDESGELRRCIRDLSALAAQPAVWNRREPHGVAQGLADSLLAALGPDVVYVCVNGLKGRRAVEAVRAARGSHIDVTTVASALLPLMNKRHATEAATMLNLAGDGALRVCVLPLGREKDYGFAAVGSRRPDFPTEFERLLFGVGVDQSVAALENATLLATVRAANRLQQEVLERERQARAAAETAELRYRDLIQELDAIVWEAETHPFRLTFVSDRAAAILGYPCERWHAEAELWTEIVHIEDRTRVASLRETAGADGSQAAYEYRARAADGSVVWLHDTVYAAGGSRQLRGITVDITERKRSEEALWAAQRLESIGVLAGGIAHDLNNLLVGVIGNASQALDLAGPGSPPVRLLQEVVCACEGAAGLTRRLLAYAGRGQAKCETIDVSALVRDIHPLIRTAIANATLDLDLAADLPPVEGDPSQLQQVAMNLIINAAEAIGDRTGTVTVRTGILEIGGERPSGVPERCALPAGRYVRLEVRDTGCGMDEDTKSHIFDPFFTTKVTGRGLGLASASGIIRSHRGGVEVESQPGQGSRFVVYLPAAPERQTQRDEPAARKTERVEGGVVLVVDDSAAVRRTAARSLERFGYEVKLAAGGAEAVALLEEAPGEIAAVLLDLTMPGMDGLKTLRRLKAIRHDLPVILSSGYSAVETMRRFEDEDLAGFVQKPYSAAQVAEKLDAILNRPPR